MDLNLLFEQHQNDIFLFSKVDCPFCDRLEAELSSLAVPFYKYVLDSEDHNYTESASALKDKTGMKTFPMLYFGKQLVGGYSDFMAIAISIDKLNDQLESIGIKIENDF